MKKFLLPLFSLVVALGVSAAGFKKPMAKKADIAPLAEAQVEDLPMGYVLSALYDDANYLVPNFYVILSSDANSKYDANTGDISAPANTFTLVLDLFAMPESDGISLPAGTYTMLEDDDNPRIMGFTHEYSMLNFYDYQSGQISIQLENPIDVVRNSDGTYNISTLVNDGYDGLIRVSYNGPLVMRTATERPTVYPQIKSDINANLNKGGICTYQGITDYSNYGVSILDLYDVDFDNETGFMKGDGTHLSMMFAHKRYKNSNYVVTPGEYTNATNLDRDTWYPAREISYMGVTYPFGSFIRQMKVVNGQNTYTYAYLKSGSFTIVDNGNGTFSGTLDAVTTLGYTVKATFSGSIKTIAEAQVPVGVSDLEDDVTFDFSPLEFGRIYHSGIQGGCRTLIVDLGSPSGKDESVVYGGDILRMEFLVDPKFTQLNSGVYTVVPRRWNSDELRAGGTYEPGSLNKGYFDNQGAQIGTRYAHFEDGRWGVYDMVGPAEEGQVVVETDDWETYTFTINLLDDQGFKMEGEWINKPLQYCYDPDAIEIPGLAGIEGVGADNDAVKVVREGSDLVVLNAGNEAVALYDVEGRLVKSGTADKVIPVAGLAKGIYIVKVKNTTVKVAL